MDYESIKNTFKNTLLLSFDSAQDDGVETFPSICQPQSRMLSIKKKGQL